MRKHLVLLCAVFALFACGKFGPEVETPEVSEISVSDIVFDFTVKYPVGTKIREAYTRKDHETK